MTKREKSKVSKLRFRENLKKKNQEKYIKATEGLYTSKNFLGNLSRSMGKEPDSLYPEKADKIFKINDLVDLRLINNKTYTKAYSKKFHWSKLLKFTGMIREGFYQTVLIKLYHNCKGPLCLG